MDELSKEYIVSFYDKSLQLHGDRPEALRWSPQGQRLHYQSLLDVGDLNGKKILDFGCGKGDFYGFLTERNIAVHYSGYDINEKLIALARKKFPQCTFSVFDIEKETLDEYFDYIFLCGVFNLEVQGVDETIVTTLKKLFVRCRMALVFNGLSVHDPKKDFELHYVSPEELFAFAVRELSPYVSLRHDRMAYDFVMCVYREAHGFSGMTG